jgi:hypothetical protein
VRPQGYTKEEVEIVSTAKKLMGAGEKAGKKVLSTDAGQNVVGAVVDALEELVVQKADDAADEVKSKAARAGGHRAPRSTTRKTTGRKKTSARKKTATKPATRKTSARKTTASRRPVARKKTTRRKPASRTRKTAGRKAASKKTSARKR